MAPSCTCGCFSMDRSCEEIGYKEVQSNTFCTQPISSSVLQIELFHEKYDTIQEGKLDINRRKTFCVFIVKSFCLWHVGMLAHHNKKMRSPAACQLDLLVGLNYSMSQFSFIIVPAGIEILLRMVPWDRTMSSVDLQVRGLHLCWGKVECAIASCVEALKLLTVLP